MQSSLDLCRVRDSPRVASALHSRPFPHRDRLQKVGQLFMSSVGCDQSHTYPHLAILYFSPYASYITRKLAHKGILENAQDRVYPQGASSRIPRMHVFVATIVATNPDSLEGTENLGKTVATLQRLDDAPHQRHI